MQNNHCDRQTAFGSYVRSPNKLGVYFWVDIRTTSVCREKLVLPVDMNPPVS